MEHIKSLKDEIWKPLKNNEERYLMSNYGRVYSIKRKKIINKTNGGVYITIEKNRTHISTAKTIYEMFNVDEIKFTTNIKYKKLQLPGEIWKDAVGWEGEYEVSNIGRVRSKSRYVKQNYWREGKILITCISKLGYEQVPLRTKRMSKNTSIHRLVAQAFIPNPENKPEVNHLDNNRSNNKVENLEWVTKSENLQYSYKTKGRDNVNYMKGEQVKAAKLKEKDIIEIRKMYAENIKIKEISEIYKVGISAIHNIITRKRWKHI